MNGELRMETFTDGVADGAKSFIYDHKCGQ
jgi:hypothetical protein